MRSLQEAVRRMMTSAFTDTIVQAASEADAPEETLPFAYAVHTQSKPLSMYSGARRTMCFPHCFPYGDGVFGLPRAWPLTFQQWAQMLLLREELAYDVQCDMLGEAEAWFSTPAVCEPSNTVAPDPEVQKCECLQCARPCQAFQAPRQPRWGRDREVVCCLYDSCRRMEQIRLAKAHVRRSG